MITFKEIEMSGFKSFADDTHINFDGGITAIVGPNGCGKSNVSDAIRWVLGEQSSKALRGKSMQDVIFAGTEKRKRLSYCEVSLVFDNTQKWFNIDHDEVVITRKLYRSGESDYQINHQPCRLKDIRDILYDSGIGKDGYSIIGQGRVEEIIQSKPEERRAIFEEAAGIAKFKARKVETENSLVRTRENLSRITDIMSEVERRLGPLKQQSDDAKKYLELRDQLKTLEINAYIYQYDHASLTKNEINTKLIGYRDNYNVLTEKLDIEQANYDKTLNEINSLDHKANELHDQVLQNTIALEKQQGDYNVLNERANNLSEQISRLNSQKDAYTLDLNQKKALLDSVIKASEEAKLNLNKLRDESTDITNKYLELVDELTKTEGEKEQNQKDLIDNLSKITDIKANLSAYVAKKETLSENLKLDKVRFDELNNEKNSLIEEKSSLEKRISELNLEKNELKNKIDFNKQKISSLSLEIADLNSQVFALKTAVSNDTNRKNILSNLQADFEGYQFAVKRLLQESKNNPKLNAAIKGVVGNLISTDEKYQTAIEIALSGSIQNIVTKNEEDAKVLIDYLKNSKLGRATFLPISAVKPRTLNINDRKYLTMKGCLGVASELVHFDSQYKNVVDSLLGATVVCDNIDNAVNIARSSGYAFRIVTLEGDLLSPAGSMSGGSKKSNDSSLLNKENEIKSLTEKIEIENKKLNEVEKVLAEKTNLFNELNNENEKLIVDENNLNNNYATLNSKYESIKDNIASLDEDIFSIESQIKVADDIVKDLTNKINSIDSVELDYANTKSKVGEFNEQNKSQFEGLKLRRDEYQEKITSVRVEIASTEEKIRSFSMSIDTYTQDIEYTEKLIKNIDSELFTQNKVYNEIKSMCDVREQNTEVKEIKTKLDELNNKLSQFDEFKSTLMNELKEIDERKNTIFDERNRVNNKIVQEESKLERVDIDIENMQERIYEEYEMTYNDCLKFKTIGDDFDIRETSIAINKFKTEINKLGAININAIDEYKSEGARYDDMLSQVEDLRSAEADAVKIIKDLSSEMLTQFNTEFEKIQANFTKVFKELFGGGNARLEILPSEDPLTAGIEIIAQPPGKVLSNITLLSGGEKTMTAIAILFAILKLKPMPFCFLDEIEAALDDSNIERYAQYLKRFSDETQFIVITHRKPTMEVVDSLYGVTMEEKGVSKIVSVKLADAVKVAENDKDKIDA